MRTMDKPIDHLLVSQLSDVQLEHMNRFENLIRKEVLPDDPPIPFDEALKDWRNLPDFIEVEFWFIWNAEGDALIATGEGDIYHTGDNEHLLEFNIRVLPEARRCGYAKLLLPKLTAFARAKNRSLMVTATNDRIPAGAAFMEKLGAERGLETHMNQLCVSELNQGLIQAWLNKYAHLENEFAVIFLDGAYPEAELTKIADMYQEVANDQPRDNLKMEDMIITPDFMRQMERNTFATGTERWTIYLRERASDIVAGLTEVY
jgi:GNAT superfamily N-acetyltransferase